jgi:hypothetical protein
MVVWRERGRRFSLNTLKEWVDSSWSLKHSPLPTVENLAKGWFILKFSKAEDVNWVLKELWKIDSMLVLLKK